jgi:TolB-like protein
MWYFRHSLVAKISRELRHNTGAVDVKQVARELGVRYVLEGSGRKAATACASPAN